MAAITALKEAPAFELPSFGGDRYSLKEGLARGPVLAVFFKVACSTCQYAFPFIERMHQQLGPSGAQIWGVSQDDAARSRKFAEEYGITFPILIDDAPYLTSKSYRVKFTPTLFLIDGDSRVEISGDGFSKSDLNAIHRWLAKHLSVSPPLLFRQDEKIPEYKPG